ncbi:MAG: hypothetical protein LBP73_02315 [Clostridiales Family XIII bacterium]|jgi:Holliday junction resolvase-like predicted endonuclease|nr:hypothetical protein [Clostridiales Family XIII bacterium]
MNNEIIGVGWMKIRTKEDRYDMIRTEAQAFYANGTKGAIRAVNAMRQMQTRDLIWTRLDGVYYLCKVGEKLWKDRVITAEHERLDLCNFVSAKWLKIGTEDEVPGKAIASFRARGSVQRVRDIEEISKRVWNAKWGNKDYETVQMSIRDIWGMLSADETESLVLLYLQNKGYYIYATTLKRDTSEIECVMVKNDGSHLLFPQIKTGNTGLSGNDYNKFTEDGNRVLLFATSENYDKNTNPLIEYLTKHEMGKFVLGRREILPKSVLHWMDEII